MATPIGAIAADPEIKWRVTHKGVPQKKMVNVQAAPVAAVVIKPSNKRSKNGK